MSLLKRLEAQTIRHQPAKGGEKARGGSRKDPYAEIKISAHHRLIEEMGEKAVTGRPGSQQEVESGDLSARLEAILDEIAVEAGALIPRADRQRLVEEVLAEVVGYGPIQPLVVDPLISEIMVNGRIRFTSSEMARYISPT